MPHRRRAHVSELLERHRPADDGEEVYRARMLELAGADADPFSRASFAPGHFTASAFVLAPDDDALLLILHRKLGRWLQPGGHVDPDDVDLIMAARREVEEETGISAGPDLELLGDGAFDLDIHPIPPHPKSGEPAHEHFDVRFLFRAKTRALRTSDEVDGARWIRLDAIAELGEGASDRSVMRAVEKLLQRRPRAAAGQSTVGRTRP